MADSATGTSTKLGFVLGLGIVLNILLPKGGFYAGGVPLTWGYLFLFPTTVWGTIGLFFYGRVSMARIIAFVSCLPFVGVAALTIGANGALQPTFVIALFVSFGLLPFALYIAYDEYLPREKIEVAMRFAAAGFFIVAVWGIIGFVFSAITKTPLDIPFITTGGGSELTSADRNNWRGALYKLTSTFNNGNLYGVCALMILPIAARLQPQWKVNIIKLSIVLTLSRSAWAGLIFYEIGHATFIRRRKGALKYLLAALTLVAILLGLMLMLLGTDTAFIFSTDLGGRLHTYENIGELLPFSVRMYDDIDEIIYPSVLSSFGFLGLGAFLLAMLSPLWLRYLDPRPYNDLDRAIVLGMATYLMMCWADGALLYIPIMFFYLSLATSLLANPEKRPVEGNARAPAAQQALS